MHQIAAFYTFSPVRDVPILVAQAKEFCQQHHILGTVLIAPEGVNGTMSCGKQDNLENFLIFLAEKLSIPAIAAKFSQSEEPPFRRLKVKPKAEIVAMGVENVVPEKRMGIQAEPELWNSILSDPETLVVDTRNAYEITIGSFPGAVDPQTATFRDFPEHVKKELSEHKGKKKIAMFCTGGIRCEKASSYLLDQGFEEVYQLSGGILGYFEKTAQLGITNKWVGDCFVFDDRVAITKTLKPSGHLMCSVCRHPLGSKDLEDERTVLGSSCLHCYGTRTQQRMQSSQERYRQVLLAKDRGFVHLSPNYRINDKEQLSTQQNHANARTISNRPESKSQNIDKKLLAEP